MEAIEITVEERADKGTSAGRRFRRSGQVPAVVYGAGKDSQMIVVDELAFNKSLAGRGPGQLLKFKSSNKTLSGQLALIKDIQIEPIKDKLLHLDFLAVDENKPIRVLVAVEVTGESPEVKAGEAILNMNTHEIEVECLPTKIPSAILVDISKLALGHSIHARDLELPEGVKLKSDPSLSVVSAVQKMAEEAAAPAVPAADAAAATPAAGAPAAADKAAPQKK